MIRNVLSALVVALSVGFLVGTPNVVSASPVGGGKTDTTVIAGGTSISYTVKFKAGEATRIRLSGDGDSCLELRVYDDNGNLVASDTLGLGDDRTCYVTPKWTGAFKIVVKNLGPATNKYTIIAD